MDQEQEDQINPELNEDLLSVQAQSLQVQIDSFDRESLMIKREDHERRQLIDKLEDLGYEYQLKCIIANLLTIYMELQFNASELTKLFGLQDQYTRLTIQLARLCMIGTLQIQQLIENTFDSELLGSYSLQKGHRNTDAMKTLFEYQDKNILPQLIAICNEFFNKKKKQTIIQLTTEFRYQMAKLLSTLEFMPFAAVVKQDDIMFKLKVSHRWEILMKHVVVRVLGSTDQLKKSKENVINAIQSAQAMLQKKDESVWFKDVIHNFGSLYFMVAKKHQKQKAHLFVAETKNELAFAVWNLGESGMMKKLMPVMFQPITYKKKIYIPRIFKHIDLQWFQNMQGDKIADPDQPYLKDKPQLETLLELTKKNLTSERVKIRILCSSKLTAMPQDKQIEKKDYSVAPKWIKNYITRKEQEGIYTDVILHIRIYNQNYNYQKDGGGFVSMSSRSHQNYTRKWANQINVPIFSLDYRLSPQNQFPDALDDCWQAYLWILHFSPHYFNIIPKRIILVGDSAGGNLVASLTNLCIKQNVQLPYAQLLIYPALDINLHNYTPSRIIALDDALLPHTFLKLCIQSYVQTDQNMNDPLISPINATQDMIKKYPITRIMTGTDDPLHDDNWRLLEKLIENKIDCQLYLYPDMPHGLISFDPLMPQCAQCVEDAKQILINILQK